jgi:hypothetical protein
MILLITPADRGPDCAKAMEDATTEATQLASTLRKAATLLRSQEYSAVVIDQFLLEAAPDEGETVLQHLESLTKPTPDLSQGSAKSSRQC